MWHVNCNCDCEMPWWMTSEVIKLCLHQSCQPSVWKKLNGLWLVDNDVSYYNCVRFINDRLNSFCHHIYGRNEKAVLKRQCTIRQYILKRWKRVGTESLKVKDSSKSDINKQQQTWCLTSTETVRLIRDGKVTCIQSTLSTSTTTTVLVLLQTTSTLIFKG